MNVNDPDIIILAEDEEQKERETPALLASAASRYEVELVSSLLS